MTEKTTEPKNAPLIGQFPEGGKENKPRLPRKEEVETLEETQETSSEETEKKPPTYEEQLKTVGLTKAEARLIMEKILTEGYYEETYEIGSTPVVLRTRSYNDTLRAQNYLEAESPSYPASIQETLIRYNVAASLSRVGDRAFKFEAEKDIDVEEEFMERYRYLVRCPEVLMRKLSLLVHKFDTKMAAVFADEAPEDF